MFSSKFTHLNIPIIVKSNEVLTSNKIEKKYLFYIKKIVVKSFLLSILKKLSYFYQICETIKRTEFEKKKSISLLEKNSPDAHKFGSGYGYSNELFELERAFKYKCQIEEGFSIDFSENGKLYDFLINKLQKVLFNEVEIMINFGVSYAYIDSQLALKNPDCKFIGLDRSSLTKKFNQECFGHIPNLEFLAGDIFDVLKQKRFDNGVFLTSRTLCLLSKSFIQRLYKAVADAGFRYIIGVEQIGISRQTKKIYEFSEIDQASVLYRGTMYIHNYPRLLSEAGFKISETELVETNHPHSDFRFISFIGESEG